MTDFQKSIIEGIPDVLPEPKPFDPTVNHAPHRKQILTADEKKLALKNALRYFPPKHHATLIPEFKEELETYGRIYMYRLRPDYKIYARSIDDFPYKSRQAAAIMLMISNNLDMAVAQHPHELIVYGGNGAAFQNWAQYRLTMQYLSQMTDEQTLVLYSGHPLGLFPSHKDAPRLVITNGMVIPNYSSKDHWEKFNALGVSQYGQMTAGSFMYIGPQGIVHGTTITVMNAARMHTRPGTENRGKLFVSSGLGGMSGAQGKASVIAGVVGIIAEINPKAIRTRYSQGWVDEVYTDPMGSVVGVRRCGRPEAAAQSPQFRHPSRRPGPKRPLPAVSIPCPPQLCLSEKMKRPPPPHRGEGLRGTTLLISNRPTHSFSNDSYAGTAYFNSAMQFKKELHCPLVSVFHQPTALCAQARQLLSSIITVIHL